MPLDSCFIRNFKMDPFKSRVYDDKKSLDRDFAPFLKGVGGVHFRTEEDDDLERQALAEIEKLQQELNPEEPSQVEYKRSIQTPMTPSEENVLGMLQTRNSRRKRTVGAENSRPATMPVAKSIMKPPSETRTIVTQSTGFETRPFTSFTTDESKISKTKDEEEAKSPEQLRIKLLETQLANLLAQKERMISEQKARFDNQLQQEKQILTRDYEGSVNQLKEWFDSKKSLLESARRQQEKIASLSQTLSKNVQTVSSLNQQFSRDKNYSENLKEQELIAKEKSLELRESRLTSQVQILDQDKQKFANKVRLTEEIEAQKRNSIYQDKLHLRHELDKLEKYQEELKAQERKEKKQLAMEKHQLSLYKDQIEREEKEMWADIEERERKLIEKEDTIENEKNEAIFQIQQEKGAIIAQMNSIENFKKNINAMFAELERRTKYIEERAKDIKIEIEYISKESELLEREREKYEKEAQKVHQMSVEISQQTELIVATRKDIDTQKNDLEKKKQEALTLMAASKSEKLKIDQKTRDLINRMKTFECLRTLDISEVEIPKMESIDIDAIKVPKVSRQIRSKSVAPVARKFNSQEFLKELEPYNKAREEFQNYLTTENSVLLNSKLACETGITKSMIGSRHVFSDASNSFFGQSSYFSAGSFAKPIDSIRKSRNFESFSSNNPL
ncbi:unnamed protein product [Blepharisma stoltei]|uniref:Uncharacterized protein n=1 Tax=Blepharisma stoltei TaxID=1481888 RepID=A0AAU9K949_9CILI|nr:unnamed protein product [Blepharisma stoltei]